MAANSAIEWTHHTFNPWRGCTKVSAGCANCYAETLSHRNPKVLGVWGPNGSRAIASESYWRQPIAWNKAAKLAGQRHRVFCASLADVFEGPETMPAGSWEPVAAARRRLFKLIQATPNLDWLLLTKRPENVIGLTRRAIDPFDDPAFDYNAAAEPNGLEVATFGDLFPNVWLGTSVEDQAAADKRITALLKIPARVRFLSAEPLLGPINLDSWLTTLRKAPAGIGGMDAGSVRDCSATIGRGLGYDDWPPCIDWVIIGGESGGDCRRCELGWVRSLVFQCQAAGVACFVKQLGGNVGHMPEGLRLRDRKGGDQAEWPADLMVREFPAADRPVAAAQ